MEEEEEFFREKSLVKEGILIEEEELEEVGLKERMVGRLSLSLLWLVERRERAISILLEVGFRRLPYLA